MTKLADEALIAHVAFILEAWDMKPPPNDFTGHNYRDIARDIIAALRQPGAMSQSERDAQAVMNPQSGAVSAVNTGQVFKIGVGYSRIGVFTEAFDGLKAERDAALARVAELGAGVGNIKKLATKRLFEGGPDGNLAAIEGFARALLEGSKP